MPRPPSAVPESKVARFLSAVIDASEKRQVEIAEDIGISPVNQNFISMIKTGKTKLPIGKVGALARSLGIDPKHLLRLWFEEYHPEVFAQIKDEFGMTILSRAEREMIELVREQSKVRNPRLRTAAEKKTFLAFLNTLSPDD